jgi:hypothetical protein
MGVSGIRPSFLGLSRSSGQVLHVLLTRSPLALLKCCHKMEPVRLACVRHAASVRPEPGSNSPSRSEPTVRAEARAVDVDRFEEPVRSPRPHRLASKVLSCHVPEGSWLAQMLELTVVCSATDPVAVQTPALAFTVLCSVFKERRAHGGTPKRSCGGAVSCPWEPAGAGLPSGRVLRVPPKGAVRSGGRTYPRCPETSTSPLEISLTALPPDGGRQPS